MVSQSTQIEAQELRLQLRNLSWGHEAAGSVAALFAALYERFRLLRPGKRAKEWAAFVTAEGLRVEDLVSRPGRDVVRGFACALVGVGLTERDAGVVVGVPRPTLNRWVREAGVERPARPRRGSHAEVGAAAVALVRAEAAAAPLSAEPGLFLAIEQFRVVSRSLDKCASAFQGGRVEGSHVEGRLRQLHAELSVALDLVGVWAGVQGVRL